MNREIKFEYGFTNHAPIRMKINEIEAFYNMSYELSMGEIKYRRQFTGLHDINGVEIYEGDIVLISKDERYVLDTEKTMQVVFKRGAFYGKSSHHSVGTLISSNLLRTKVIGNIHQNPELLK